MVGIREGAQRFAHGLQPGADARLLVSRDQHGRRPAIVSVTLDANDMGACAESCQLERRLSDDAADRRTPRCRPARSRPSALQHIEQAPSSGQPGTRWPLVRLVLPAADLAGPLTIHAGRQSSPSSRPRARQACQTSRNGTLCWAAARQAPAIPEGLRARCGRSGLADRE